MRDRRVFHFVAVVLATVISTECGGNPNIVQADAIEPMDGCAWVAEEGIRAAWLSYKQIDEAMVEHLHNARVNTVFLKHGMHDLLDLDSVQYVDKVILAKPREDAMRRMLESTRRAASAGIHVFWVANYELAVMLPHLKRLGYQPAYSEGPSRYLRPGPNEDAAPLDPVFWKGITGAHGELVANLSRENPIDGLLYDTEHYAGGMMYLQSSGFSQPTFSAWSKSRNVVIPDDVQPGMRHDFLKSTGRLEDYQNFLEEQAFDQGRALAERWHAVNPHLIIGIWPLLDNWFSQGLLRGFGDAVPTLGLSGVEYYHGADQSRAMAQFFESRNPNLIYMPGFYPPYAYTVEQLGDHVETALRGNGHYWMLGPHAELAQTPYQTALRDAYENATEPPTPTAKRVQIDFSVESDDAGSRFLIVESDDITLSVPTLSLWSTFGGAALCKGLPMKFDGTRWRAMIPLVRRITNNRYLEDGYRSGATYKFDPVPRELNYADRHHTKLVDGRAYGYFGTTVAWPKTQKEVTVEFDLHRPYRIVKVEIAQPTKLEDRIGGPAELAVAFLNARGTELTAEPRRLLSTFPVHVADASEPDNERDAISDPRHNRAWLSWAIDVPSIEARRIRLSAALVRSNSAISLGEVVIHAIVTGEIQAKLTSGGKTVALEQRRYTIAVP